MTPHKPLTYPSLSFHTGRPPAVADYWISYTGGSLNFFIPLFFSVPQLKYSKSSINIVSYLLSWLKCKKVPCLLFAVFLLLDCPSAWFLNGAQYLTTQTVFSLSRTSVQEGSPLLWYPWVKQVVQHLLVSMSSQNKNTLVMWIHTYRMTAPGSTDHAF